MGISYTGKTNYLRYGNILPEIQMKRGMVISYQKDEWRDVREYLTGMKNGVMHGNLLQKDELCDVWESITGKTNGVMYGNLLPERQMV